MKKIRRNIPHTSCVTNWLVLTVFHLVNFLRNQLHTSLESKKKFRINNGDVLNTYTTPVATKADGNQDPPLKVY